MTAEREPYRRSSIPDEISQNLPPDQTCGNCIHFNYCERVIGRVSEDEICDWSPSRFSTDRSKLFLLQNVTAGYVGNSPVFWREGGSGYTQWVDEAKWWTEAEADAVIHSTSGTHRWAKWSALSIENLAKRTIDIQDSRDAEARLGGGA